MIRAAPSASRSEERRFISAGNVRAQCCVTVSYDGSDTLVFTGGDSLNHDLRFALDGGDDQIIDSQPIVVCAGRLHLPRQQPRLLPRAP